MILAVITRMGGHCAVPCDDCLQGCQAEVFQSSPVFSRAHESFVLVSLINWSYFISIFPKYLSECDVLLGPF